ncbi:MAG: hypothetical protein Q8O25_00655 [Sulfurisoma sp.]|nr:hypothetical protein [Sulfurisoma sp.]
MSAFHDLYTGRLWSLMSWDQLTAFWGRIDPAAGWYLYAVGEPPPAAPAAAEATRNFMHHVDELLRREHHHDYCAIVYADDIEKPGFIKIYDPNNLGVSCGFSTHPPLPGWIMCQVPPEDLKPAHPLPEGRRRWWSKLFN